jgi:predicted O-methyltransferase YrrM
VGDDSLEETVSEIDQLLKYDRANPGGAGTSPEEKFFLYGLVRQMKPEVIVELGSRCGHSACWLALGLKHNKRGVLTCVDTFEGQAGGGGGSAAKVRQRLKAARVKKFAHVIEMDSQKFLKGCDSDIIDLVYVDAAHTFNEALADIKESYRVAEKLVVVHDSLNLPGVTEACKTAKGGTWIPGYRGMWIKSKAGIWRTARK